MEEKTQETQETTNEVSTLEDLQAIKAELEEEKKAKAAAEAVLADKDVRIVALESALSEAKRGSEATATELASVKQAKDQAVSKYLEAARALNSTIPQDVISGGTIEEIDASVRKALSIADAVKATLEAQAKEAKVPAGAPTRGEISLEGLSPREKIAAGIQQGSQR
jgi:DNA repair exonuclease SbcCD ATPase subunit